MELEKLLVLSTRNHIIIVVSVVVMGDDPLKGMSADSLKQELDSVSLDWKPLRSVKACPCFTHFDHFMNKVSQFEISKLNSLCRKKSRVKLVCPNLQCSLIPWDQIHCTSPTHCLQPNDNNRYISRRLGIVSQSHTISQAKWNTSKCAHTAFIHITQLRKYFLFNLAFGKESK